MAGKPIIASTKGGGREKIGPFQSISTKQARGRAQEILAGYLRGEDPAEQRKQNRASIRYGEFLETMYFPWVDANLRSAYEYKRVLKIANAKNEATYLLGDVEIVDEYKLYNINRIKLEGMIKKIFADARLNLSIKDRFGKSVQATEWFLVTREAVAQAVELIQSGDIKNHVYDRENAVFKKLK